MNHTYSPNKTCYHFYEYWVMLININIMIAIFILPPILSADSYHRNNNVQKNLRMKRMKSSAIVKRKQKYEEDKRGFKDLRKRPSEYFVGEAAKQVEYYSKGFQVQKGEKIMLECQGNLGALLQYHFPGSKGAWSHNGNPYTPDDDRHSVTKHSNLVFNSVQPVDNGVWTCNVLLGGSSSSAITTAVYALAVENDVPDVTTPTGRPLVLDCRSSHLAKFFTTSKMATQWYHNSSLFKEFEDSKLEDAQELRVDAPTLQHSGVWSCKVVERPLGLNRPPKEWMTSVFRVMVVPDDGKLQKQITLYLAVAGLVVFLVVLALVIRSIRRKLKRNRVQDVPSSSSESSEECSDESSEEEELTRVLKKVKKTGRW